MSTFLRAAFLLGTLPLSGSVLAQNASPANPANQDAKSAGESSPAPEQAVQPVELGIFVAQLRGAGALKNDVKPAASFGLGVGRDLIACERSQTRATALVSNRTKLAARQAGVNGGLSVQTYGLRVDHLLVSPVVEPYIGLGVSYHVWALDTDQGTQSHRMKGKAGGLGATLGAQYHVLAPLSVAPEVSYSWIGGSFREKVLNLALMARWRL